MSTDILPFEFEAHQVRVLDIDGEPWFVLADLLNVLGITRKPSAVIERLDDGVRQTYPIHDSLGRTQDAHIVNESGMYEVVIRSDSPAAKPFRRWVTHDVIPQIRKTGSYGTTALSEAEIVHQALQITARQVRELEAKVTELEPKAARFDDWLGAKGDYSFREAAKILQRDHGVEIGPRRLIDTLLSWGWVYRHGKRKTVTAYQAQLETGRLTQRATTYTNQQTGEIITGDPQTRVTPKGIRDIADRLTRGEVAA